MQLETSARQINDFTGTGSVWGNLSFTPPLQRGAVALSLELETV